jgi:hypothetical protein
MMITPGTPRIQSSSGNMVASLPPLWREGTHSEDGPTAAEHAIRLAEASPGHDNLARSARVVTDEVALPGSRLPP